MGQPVTIHTKTCPITPTSRKEPTLCYTLDKILILTQHSHGKKNYQFQNFTRINQTFARRGRRLRQSFTRIIVRMSQRTRDKTEEHFLQNISRYSISLTKPSKLNKKNKPNKKKQKKKKVEQHV